MRVLVGETDCYNWITSRVLSGPNSELTVFLFPGGLLAAAPMPASTPPTTSSGRRLSRHWGRWRVWGRSPGVISPRISTTATAATLLPSWSWRSPRPSSSPTPLTSSVLPRVSAGTTTEHTRLGGGSPRTWTAAGWWTRPGWVWPATVRTRGTWGASSWLRAQVSSHHYI